MVVIIVIITVIIFVLADYFVRLTIQKAEERKLKKERAAALDISLRLDFTTEAKTLKRVEVDNPKAKILAVDDEEIVLASFRKILVLAGYSIDTVETGPEALGLIQKHDYDFVFTDLKMPDMDGIEVTKAVKHLRPDIDVIVITGYATIESAVETMKYGAMDYVQKPFTEDELVAFVNKALIRRQDRIEKTTKPQVRLVTPSIGESTSKHEINVPSGIFLSPCHSWISLERNGLVRIGIDDFAQKILGKFDKLTLPNRGQRVNKGDHLFSVHQGNQTITFPAPISGKIVSVHAELNNRINLLHIKPYELGWICSIEPSNLHEDLKMLKIGAEAVDWYQKEVDKYQEMVKAIVHEQEKIRGEKEISPGEAAEQLQREIWARFPTSFLKSCF